MVFMGFLNCVPEYVHSGGSYLYSGPALPSSTDGETVRGNLILRQAPSDFGFSENDPNSSAPWVIVPANRPYPVLRTNDVDLYLVPFRVNDEYAWAYRAGVTGSFDQFFYDASIGKWVLWRYPRSGDDGSYDYRYPIFATPSAYQDLDGTWVGGGWWELNRLPAVDADPVDPTPKGVFLNGAAPTQQISLVYPRYERITTGNLSEREPYGLYRATGWDDGEDRPDLVVGSAVFSQGGLSRQRLWRKQTGADMWIRDPARDEDEDEENPIEGNVLKKSGDVYVIGTRNSGTWWETRDRPEAFGSTVRLDEFTMDGSLPTGTGRNVELSFKYVGAPPASSKVTLYEMEVPTWQGS